MFGNYAGDNMNVKMAVQMAEDDDIEVKYVVANDDVASAPKAVKEQRHGIAGGFLCGKLEEQEQQKVEILMLSSHQPKM